MQWAPGHTFRPRPHDPKRLTATQHCDLDPIISKIQPFENIKIYKEMSGHPDASEHSVRMAIHFFGNSDIFEWLYLQTSLNNTKLGDFVNFGVFFLIM